MTTEPPAKKRAKTNDDSTKEIALVNQVWEHYRNFLDSCQEEDNAEGDTDELQEIVALLKDLVVLPSTTLGTTKESLLPVVASLAHLQLANVAITETVDSTDGDNKETTIQHHLQESLRYFPQNCAAWSIGANYARMGQLVPPPLIVKWYQRAASHASSLRTQALELLEGDDEVEDETVKEWLELLILVGMVDTEYVEDEDDEEEEDEEVDVSEEKDAEEKEEEGYYSTSAVEATSRFMSAMLLSTLGKHDESLKQLQHFDLTHRLHPNVWRPTSAETTSKSSDGPTEFTGAVLPKDLYDSMCSTFAPDAVYWKESDYAHRGYYSYFFNIQESPTNLIEEVICNHLLPLAKKCQADGDDEIVGAEWWVHHRPIKANLGHNLHFDTDEALLSQEGTISHPTLSSVLYLTAGEAATSGPTIVLDQPPDAIDAATKCWKCVPKENSFMVFNGCLLHGVLPCPGKQDDESSAAAANDADTMTWKPKQEEEEVPHRLTFMVGFWTRRVPDKMKNRRLYGPCGPLPPADSTEWVQNISEDYPQKTVPSKNIQECRLITISPAWEVIQPTEGDSLEIPRAIDHRFFVNGVPKCFRDSLFEKDEDDEEC